MSNTRSQTDSQVRQILKYLLSGKSITSLEAVKRFDCLRLGARIFNIKAMNRYKIKTEMIVTKSKKRIARYSIPV